MNTRKIGKKSLNGLSLLTALLAGCGPEVPKDQEKERVVATSNTTYKVGGYVDVYATEFKLEDGTRCVGMVNGGGITCNWKQ